MKSCVIMLVGIVLENYLLDNLLLVFIFLLIGQHLKIPQQS